MTGWVDEQRQAHGRLGVLGHHGLLGVVGWVNSGAGRLRLRTLERP
jgi:hypothetical protein